MTITRPPSFVVESSENGSLVMRNIILGPPCWISSSMSTTLYLMHYYIVFCGLCGAALIYSGFDAFMFSAALHICGQFEILNSSTETITDEGGYWKQKHRIKEYSKRHAKLLALGTQLNEIVNFIIFSELISNGFLICISGISILTSIKNGNVDNDDLNFGVRIFVWYMGLFMYTFVGERLSNQAEKLQIAIYNIPWYNMPTTIARDIQFIIMRNNSPCHLTACGIMNVNYEAFKDITRLMFSCFSVLKLVLE
ncbi:odorant receptor 22c-like [Fopius arisanus]|uniref:Odorant receptor 22c-like n=1 Tax=Fopius arisanus TaxID=64838 RepID=A0A9R1SXG1_9HYME|nr:PREDICTED: odorant receptor 22c-like [Fopius arisanus]